MLDWILLCVSVPLIILGLLWRRSLSKTQNPDIKPHKKEKTKKILAVVLITLGGYIFVTRLLNITFGPRESENLEFSMWPERAEVLGFSLSYTVIYTWIAMAILIITALVIRFTVFRRPKDIPDGAQNVIEIIV